MVTQTNYSAKFWSSIAIYATPPAAAAFAIIPVYYGFVAKSAQQIGKPIPRMTLYEAFKGGLKASPTIGAIVGTQMIVQSVAEKMLMKNSECKNNEPDFFRMFASALMVGSISAPALAIFNGQTMGQTAKESLRRLSAKQAGAIVSRETSFLFSIRISDPVSNAMKSVFGDNKIVEYVSAFFSGAVGSIIGHPADTALTLWQNRMKVTHARQLMWGAPMKALATGGFAMCYKLINSIFDSFHD